MGEKIKYNGNYGKFDSEWMKKAKKKGVKNKNEVFETRKWRK